MPQPTTAIPAWASNATFNSGIESGLPPTLAFTSEEQTQGLKPGKVVARKLNWLFKVLCDWTAWINFSRPNFSTGSTHDMTGTCRVDGGALDWRGNVVLGNNSTAHTFEVKALETHQGQEVHNGTETHNGVSAYNADVQFNADVRKANMLVGGFRHNTSPCYYAGNADHTASDLIGGSFIFKGLTTTRSLDLTIAGADLLDNLQFTVYNNSSSYEVAVVVNGATLGYVGGGGGATTQKLFFYDLDTTTWRTS